ncbi:YtxH domain-containing protein [Pseudactinotalea sp.]|uniref:YtxH domain-containing protein n=1 Tax=Pseudactinotalea sp. TaxID=1926260 RepID=UPI003B3B39E2
MKGKAAFILGAAVGYVLGTRAGREQFEKIKASARSAMDHPAVKDKVAQAETKINDVVREQGAKVTDQVANMVKERFANGSTPRPAATTDAPDDASNGPTSAWDTPAR